MKTFKLAIFSLAMALVVFTSCTNNESVIDEPQNTEESESITTSLNQLRTQFDANGNVTQSDNPAGNVVFDFCFDFAYPLTLSYNNESSVTVDNLDNLIDIMLASTQELYINGVAFPFDVETYNEDTNAIEVVTINNENEFVTLLESCDFDDVEDCICTTEYDPICVEVSGINGETFIITYSNACHAECDGFTEEDFVENCEEDYNPSGNECYTLNYPFSIVLEDGTTVTVNSYEEYATAVYGAYYFDFVYPFTLTLENEEVVTVNSSEDIETILEDCFGDIGGGDINCEQCENEPIDTICVLYTNPANGETEIRELPNMCTVFCLGYSQEDIVTCE